MSKIFIDEENMSAPSIQAVISQPSTETRSKNTKRVKQLVIPHRTPSVVIPEREKIFPTADKVTCAECTCFPKEPYQNPRKLNQCQTSPPTLYSLAASAVDCLWYPVAKYWDVDDVAEWMDQQLGFPQYADCIRKNKINGHRLLRLEDPSVFPEINIHDLEHIKKITSNVREVFRTEYIKFARSISLPPRYPLTHCLWYKSMTGTQYGTRQNWLRSDILRWMKIIKPKPVYRDHWNLVWYEPPEFPKVLFARIPKATRHEYIPHYKSIEDICNEYLTPRKFRLINDIPEEHQFIWMEHRPGSPNRKEPKSKKTRKPLQGPGERPGSFLTPSKIREVSSSLMPKVVNLEGLRGKDLILARRLMPKKKFLA